MGKISLGTRPFAGGGRVWCRDWGTISMRGQIGCLVRRQQTNPTLCHMDQLVEARKKEEPDKLE